MVLYKTKDIGEAAALLTQGIKLISLDYDVAGFFWFVFEDTGIIQETANKYWFGNLMQNVKRYNESLKTLKDRIFSQRAISS